MAFAPRLAIWLWTRAEIPLPTATSRMTAATPMRMPSMVSSERSRLASRPRRAMRTLSRFTESCPRLHEPHVSLVQAELGRRAGHRGLAAVLHDSAVPDPHHPLGVGGYLVFVGDHHHGPSGLVEPVEDVEYMGGGGGVEVAGRLVGQDDRWTGGDGPGDGHPLLLAAGELRGQVPHAFGQPDGGQGGPRPAAAL